MSKPIEVNDLGRMAYRAAWEVQERIHERVVTGGAGAILIVEHPPVVTLGRREESIKNLIASPEELASRGVELVRSDRGGDITYHGPGQIVVYPIIRIADHGFSVSGYVHRLEAIVVQTLNELTIEASVDPHAVGVWVKEDGELPKICAIGVRIRRGISLHGLALNYDIDLAGFDYIVPCGLTGRKVTSIRKILGKEGPSLEETKRVLVRNLTKSSKISGLGSQVGE